MPSHDPNSLSEDRGTAYTVVISTSLNNIPPLYIPLFYTSLNHNLFLFIIPLLTFTSNFYHIKSPFIHYFLFQSLVKFVKICNFSNLTNIGCMYIISLFTFKQKNNISIYRANTTSFDNKAKNKAKRQKKTINKWRVATSKLFFFWKNKKYLGS